MEALRRKLIVLLLQGVTQRDELCWQTHCIVHVCFTLANWQSRTKEKGTSVPVNVPVGAQVLLPDRHPPPPTQVCSGRAAFLRSSPRQCRKASCVFGFPSRTVSTDRRSCLSAFRLWELRADGKMRFHPENSSECCQPHIKTTPLLVDSVLSPSDGNEFVCGKLGTKVGCILMSHEHWLSVGRWNCHFVWLIPQVFVVSFTQFVCPSFQMLILRDYWLCMVLSILFEIMEYTLEHQLPNFSECWWDHVSASLWSALFPL